MIIHDKKLIFIHIPKSGGTSIKESLTREWNLDIKFEKLSNFPPYIEKDGLQAWHFNYWDAIDIHPDYEYITQVRHPVNRWVSYYKMIREFHKEPYSFEEFTDKFLGVRFTTQQFKWVGECEVHRLEDKTIWKRLGIPERKDNVTTISVEVSQYHRQKIEEYFEEDMKKWY